MSVGSRETEREMCKYFNKIKRVLDIPWTTWRLGKIIYEQYVSHYFYSQFNRESN